MRILGGNQEVWHIHTWNLLPDPEVLMRTKKVIFSVLTIIFGSLGLMNIVSTDITLPIMFVFMGLTLLTNARECYDNGAKKDAMIFAGVAIFVYVVTVYNLVSRFM